jgi:hypothetical protein
MRRSLNNQLVRLLALSIMALGLPLVTGCEEPTDCTLSIVSSVHLTIVDAETGEPVPDPVITFTVDGGDPRMPEDEYPDSAFTLAYEEQGLFAVTIEADGHEPMSVEYDVMGDECHPVGVSETIELVPIVP